ncbi:MAG: alpha-L-fucosidase [Pirellulales bacterium]|nr:alpha-L-fucosidase [Pirellulales bacterium]
MKKPLLFCMVLLISAAASAQVVDRVDWEQLLSRHDLVWDQIPDRWEAGAFQGNGQLGAMIFAAKDRKAFDWQIGRSDVAFNTFRIPIGDLNLKPAGKIQSGTARLDLWNAEARGTLKTDKGEIQYRSLTHSELLVQVIEIAATGQEAVTWEWTPGLAANHRKIFRKEPLLPEDQNAPPLRSSQGDVQLCFQPLQPAGGHATAWKVVRIDERKSVVYLSVGYANDEAAAKYEAVAAVKNAAKAGLESLVRSHRAWWHRFWPESFLSIPDTRLESFYWIQIYKMACGTRPGRPALDLLGPWFYRTPWAKIWWNLNIQLTYWPQLTGNRLELGESFCELIDNGAAALAANAGEFSGDSAAIGRATGYDCVGPMEADGELCDLPWAMHNYWLHYRYSMDADMLRKRVFPMLKRSINYYLHLLKEGPDGKLHIPGGFSPEYEGQPTPNPDCNIDLALLRWGCQTLLASCERLKLDDPQIPRWKSTLEKLTPYPQDENGLRISASTPFAHSHRHYSHLLMIYPLYIMTPEQPENRDLVVNSLKHWMSMPQQLKGYSFTGAASISTLLGEGDAAARYLNRLLDFRRVAPNTLYMESGPCIETPLSAAASLHDMLLSSWGDRIRVFPAVPSAWKDCTFHNLRAEGAFLVSAVRKNGKTQWIRIKSLAGECCRIRPGLEGEAKANVPLKALGDGTFEITLAKGEEAILHAGGKAPRCEIAPLPADPVMCNFYGLRSGGK